jgi:hypothetical protein
MATSGASRGAKLSTRPLFRASMRSVVSGMEVTIVLSDKGMTTFS